MNHSAQRQKKSKHGNIVNLVKHLPLLKEVLGLWELSFEVGNELLESPSGRGERVVCVDWINSEFLDLFDTCFYIFGHSGFFRDFGLEFDQLVFTKALCVTFEPRKGLLKGEMSTSVGHGFQCICGLGREMGTIWKLKEVYAHVNLYTENHHKRILISLFCHPLEEFWIKMKIRPKNFGIHTNKHQTSTANVVVNLGIRNSD